MATNLALVTGFRPNSVQPATPTMSMHDLRWYVDMQLEEMSRFRTHIGITERMNRCLRLREGAYDPTQLAAIKLFGGSEVFARLTTNKIRGGAAMLRNIFVQGERPWEINPTPVPTLPDDVKADIEKVVMSEVQTLQQSQPDQPVEPKMIKRRIAMLMRAAASVARKEAKAEAVVATRYIDDLLTEGGFYQSLNEFILDFCTLPFAVMRGPTAVMKTGVKYVNGKPTRTRSALLTYNRVDPYDVMWSPGSTCAEDADIIERMRMSRADLGGLIGLDGYDEDAIKSIIRDYGERGHTYNQFFEAVRENVQNQDSQFYNTLIDVIAFTGKIAGWQLNDWGIPPPEGETIDDDMDYSIQAWVCGDYVIKAQVDPDPSNRINYYFASYEPVSGSIAGTALPELLGDIQETYNATLRALVNNVAIASGPQVGVNTTRWQPPADGVVRVAPWMIWRYESDPTANSGEKPVEFFQPNLNSSELIQVLQFLQTLADEISGIPRYMTGNDKMGGAGRTSSGLSMLMQNATRTMTSVAGGIDQYVLEPCLKKTYDLVLLTTGNAILRGDETIAPRGATYAETRETDRMRMIEFMQATLNPIDSQIMGIPGRAALLRHVSDSFSAGEEIVPSNEDMQLMQQKQEAEQAQQAAAGGVPPGEEEAGGAEAGAPSPQGGSPTAPQQQKDPRNQAAAGSDNMMRTRNPGAVKRASGGR